MILTSASAALPQTAPRCPRGSGHLTSATIGGDIRDGQGVGAASLGNTPADVERAWGSPLTCLPQSSGYSYHYVLTGDGGQTGWLVVVVFVDDKVTAFLVTAVPHARGPGPRIQTARGVEIFNTADEVRRRYGAAPTIERTLTYASDGIAFWLSRNFVGSILVFRQGTTPGLQP